MHAYLLVLEVSPMDVGRTYAMLPLHCTLVHWFWLDLDPTDVTAGVQRIAKNTSPLLLSSGEEATYTGTTKQGAVPVTVNVIERTPALEKFHFQICKELDRLGVRYGAPQYVKEGFSPHVTHQGATKLPKGTSHTSMAVYVVEANAPEYGNDRRICSRIALSL